MPEFAPSPPEPLHVVWSGECGQHSEGDHLEGMWPADSTPSRDQIAPDGFCPLSMAGQVPSTGPGGVTQETQPPHQRPEEAHFPYLGVSYAAELLPLLLFISSHLNQKHLSFTTQGTLNAFPGYRSGRPRLPPTSF